jgi:tetratricopeptide (TPR) repeat protein
MRRLRTTAAARLTTHDSPPPVGGVSRDEQVESRSRTTHDSPLTAHHSPLTRTRLALVFSLALSLPTIAARAADDAKPKADEVAGKRVLARRAGLVLRDQPGGKGPATPAPNVFFLVDRIEGSSLHLQTGVSAGGWAEAGEVVPVDRAVEHFSDVIAKNRRDAYAFSMRAKVLLFERDDPEHALADADEAVKIAPNDPLAHAVRGEIHIGREEYDKAIADYSEVIRLKSDDADAYYERAGAYASQQQPAKALADFNEAIRLDPKDADNYIGRATTYMILKQPDKALADFNEAIRLDPKNVDAYFGLAAARGMNGDIDGEIAIQSQIIERQPNAAVPYAARASAWRDKKEYAKAVADLSSAIRLDPKNYDYLMARAMGWRDCRQQAKAIGDCDTAIGLDPDRPDGYAFRAGLWAEQDEHDKAIADLSRLIQLAPNNAWAFCNRGMQQFEKHDYDQAVADLEKALAIDPNSPDAQNGRAWVWATCDNPKYRDGKKAVEIATRACQTLEWKEAAAIDTLAAACAEAGDFDAAIKWQTKANAMFPAGKEKTEGEARLKLYRAKTPYRLTSP